MNYEELKAAMNALPDTMTTAERGRRYSAGEMVDHLPVSIGSEEAMADIYGYTSEQFRTDVDVAVDVLRKRAEDFDISGIRVGLKLNTIGEALGSEILYPVKGVGSVSEYALKDLSELEEKLKINPYKSPVYRRKLDECYVLKERLPDFPISTEVGGPITAVANIRPLELILRDSIRHREALRSLLSLAVEHSLAWVDMMEREFGKMGCGIGDPVSSSTILSRNQYLEFSLPYQKELIDGIISIMGRQPKLHVCGRTRLLWQDMRELHVSCFSIDNIEDMEEAKHVLGDRFCISGNVAPVDVMLRGTIDEVIEASRKCIGKAGDSPCGYILGTGCQLPVGTPKENVEAFIYAARKYGRNAIKGKMPEGMIE